MNSEEAQLQREIEKLFERLNRVFLLYYRQILKLPDIIRYIKKEKPLWISRDKAVQKALEKPTKELQRKIEGMINTGMKVADQLGQDKYDRIKLAATEQSRAASANRTYTKRVNLSDKVWNLEGNTKNEIDIIVQNGIKEGKSADQISREVNKYLKEPDNLFRRVKNKETGKLEWSEAAKKYHPGQGVYRSSYKNAMRLVRTEMNAAMRYAMWKNFQDDPLIIGFRISLSNNRDNGFPCPVCEQLAGDYPKWFLWTGWHPQCRCIMTPITISNEELRKFVVAKDAGKAYTPKQIDKMPENFSKWYGDNKHRFEKEGANKPYWLLDNEEVLAAS